MIKEDVEVGELFQDEAGKYWRVVTVERVATKVRLQELDTTALLQPLQMNATVGFKGMTKLVPEFDVKAQTSELLKGLRPFDGSSALVGQKVQLS